MIAALQFEQPAFGMPGAIAIAVGLVVVAMAYTFGLRWRTQSPAMRLGLMGLRLGAVLCLLVAMSHPTWTSEREVERRPVMAVVLDTSLSMAEPATGKEGGPSRYQMARQLADNALPAALRRSFELPLFDVAGRQLAACPDSPTADATPLTETLVNVQKDMTDQPLAGIVLLSDGRQATRRPGLGSIDQLRVPVHTVQLAGSVSAARAGDLAIQSVNAPQHALVDNRIKITVDIAADGYLGGVNVPVSIRQGDRIVGAPVMVPWRGGEPAVRAELELTPTRPGHYTYTVQAGGLKDEADLSNNRQTFEVTVRAKPLTVLYVDGVLRWEGKFSRQALADDPDINVVSAIRTTRPGADAGSQGLLLPEQLASVDVVVVGDVEATYFATSELIALRNWVTERGGGLLVTGGYHSFGPAGFGRTELRRVLPVEFSAAANPQVEQPFSLKITDAGREHPIFHLTGDRVRDTAFYQSLPELAGCSRVAAVKPGAQVLATNPRITGGGDAQGLPIMVAQEVGSGRAMVLAADTTWRWRMVVGGFTGDSSFYQRFWGQIVRWLAGADDTAPQQLFLATDRYRYTKGQEIQLNVELRQTAGESPDGAAAAIGRWQVQATAMDEKGRVINVPLVERSPTRFIAGLTAPAPGRLDFAVTALPVDAASPSPEGYSRVITVQVDRDDLETLNTQPAPTFLAQVSQLTGGRLLRPEQIPEWAAQLSPQPLVASQQTRVRLWHHPLLAGLFFGLLCTEWILRRRHRLS